MAQKFKKPHEAASALNELRAVALGKVTSPTIESYEATSRYAQYHKIIDVMLSDNTLALLSSGGTPKLYREKVKELEPGFLKRAGLQAGGKSMAVFGTVGHVLTLGLVIDWKDIGESWSAPTEVNRDMKQTVARVRRDIARFDRNLKRVQKIYKRLASVIFAENTSEVTGNFNEFIKACSDLHKSYSQLERSIYGLGVKSVCVDGALDVAQDFAIQAAIVVATMGATELVLHGGKHALMKYGAHHAPKAIEFLKGTRAGQKFLSLTAAEKGGVAATSAVLAAEYGPRAAVYAWRAGHPLHVAHHNIHEINEGMEEHREFAQVHAP